MRLVWAFIVVFLVLLPVPVRADDVAEAKRHFALGTKAYELGAYDEAISEYATAYRLKDDAAILFNLGQANRLAGHSTEALRLYRMYLLKVPNSPARAEVEQRIAETQHQIEQQKPVREAAPVPPPATPVPSAAAPQPVVVTPTPATAEPPPLPRSHALLITGSVIAAVGVAGLAAGIAFGALANQAGNDLTTAAKNGQAYDYNKQQSGKTDQLLEAVLLSVGGAAVVAGTTVIIVDQRRAKRASFHAFAQPSFGQSSFIGGIQGCF
jgi:tetratricopeptide (TPR) repeat protein